MEYFKYIDPPEVPDEVINRVSNEIEYLKQLNLKILIGGKI